MGAFAASLLRGMSSADLYDLDAIIFRRESPGAMIACQFAVKLKGRA